MMINRSLSDVETDQVSEIFFLLDMTGSMNSDKYGTMNAFNEYVGGLKADGATADFKFSLAVFNSAIGIGLNMERGNITDVPDLDANNYVPRASTPLYDAIGLSIDSLKDVESSVLFIILTDGEENSSTRFSRDDITRKIASKSEAGWEFVFLGCDIDAIRQGRNIGINQENAKSYSRQESSAAMMDVADHTIAYAKRESIARRNKGFFKK